MTRFLRNDSLSRIPPTVARVIGRERRRVARESEAEEQQDKTRRKRSKKG
jgi:hypothetical protein